MSAMLYELTARAAQMCMPVPAPEAAPDGWLGTLDHWQTLAGNWVGGLLGVAGALIVAVMLRGRDRRIAAAMVLPDVQQLAAAGEGIDRWLAAQKDVPAEYRATAVMNRLRERRPALFALHSPVIGQLSDIDARLYSHLFQCEMSHREFEDGIAASDAWRDTMMGRPIDRMPRMATSPPSDYQLYSDWLRMTEHAMLAGYFLDRLVFSRWPRWVQRARMALRPNDLDLRSAHLLKTGEPLDTVRQVASATPDAAAQA